MKVLLINLVHLLIILYNLEMGNICLDLTAFKVIGLWMSFSCVTLFDIHDSGHSRHKWVNDGYVLRYSVKRKGYVNLMQLLVIFYYL